MRKNIKTNWMQALAKESYIKVYVMDDDVTLRGIYNTKLFKDGIPCMKYWESASNGYNTNLALEYGI